MSFTNQANLANLAISVRGIGPGAREWRPPAFSKHDGQTTLVLEDPDGLLMRLARAGCVDRTARSIIGEHFAARPGITAT
jgi:hypothetical protein